MNILVLFIAVALVTIVGGGGAYIIWLMSRPKKQVWKAKCYQVGEGSKTILGKDGNVTLKDLLPYSQDVLERRDIEYGRTIYELKFLGMSTNAVTADMVMNWGKDNKEVDVLIQGSTATVLKKGFDENTKNIVFTPMPRERIELIKSEIMSKKERLREKKDLIQSLTPWVVAGITVLGLITIVYFLTDSFITISEESARAEKYAADKHVQAAKEYREAISQLSGVSLKEIENNIYGKQHTNVTQAKPPSIE